MGLRSRSRWWSLQRFHRPPSWNKGVLLLREGKGVGKGRKDEGKRERGRGGKRRGDEESKGEAAASL